MQQSRTSASLECIMVNKFRYRRNTMYKLKNSKKKTLRTHRNGR